ncbi:HTH domain-containing protein [Salinigranum salinum]|uniref:HTH domain-containing protein n=1 Tax=Salinigranum salinum TaxID=1364937 RepID=UPI001260A2D2|nr:HTH domain-containing protein [Salinigranum salinum]
MTPDKHLGVDLYVRADAPIVDRRTVVIERLERLERRERIDEYSVQLWPRAISLDLMRRVDESPIVDAVREFETWAEQCDRYLSPCFDVSTTHSMITDESDRLLVLPVLCVAVFSDGSLVDVAPSSDGDSVRTVEDLLADVAAGTVPTSEAFSGDMPSGAEPDQRGLAGNANPLKSSSVTSVFHRPERGE